MFSFGGSKSKSRSTGRAQSTASSFNTSDTGSTSGSVSGGVSQSANQATSQGRIAFEDVFSRLFSSAEGGVAGLDSSLLTEASNDLFGAGTGFLEGIGGDAGSTFLQERLANAGALEQEQLDLLQSDIGELFTEELLPAITSEAVGGGQLGGGRQGVAQGLAAEAAADAYTRGSIDIRQRNQEQLDAIAAGISERSLTGTQAALGSLPGLLDVAGGGYAADLAGLDAITAILGTQNVLTDSQSTGFSSAEDFARAFSESFGRSRGGSESQSTSRTDSTSTTKSAKIGFPGFGSS